MVDDKDESAPDPWAGIDDDGAGQSADGFTFSFDAASEITDQPGLPSADEAPAALDPFPADAEDEPPTLPLEAAADAGLDADPFASLSIDADESAAVADDISAWLTEPAGDPGTEPPLAVFPPQNAEDGGHTGTHVDGPDASIPATMFEAVAAEDLHHDPHGTPEQPTGSSHVEVGTGFSGVVSPSEVDPASGVMPVDDWAENLAAESASDGKDATLDDFATDDQPSFDASGFDGVSDLGEPASPGAEEFREEALETAGAAAVAAAVATPKHRPPARKQGGGIGQLIAIVLGGVMAIPITYAILIWGFQRDPFKLTGMMPEQVAFLLPEKLQPGFKRSGGPTLDAPSALDDLPAAADVPEPSGEPEPEPEPSTEPEPRDEPAPLAADPASVEVEGEPLLADAPRKMATDAAAGQPGDDAAGTPSTPPDDFTLTPSQPAEPAAPPAPEPLDLAALEAAVGEASAAFEELTAVDPEAPDRRKLLVAWYKRLAAAAEQLVLLEKVAVDSGRSLGDAAAVIDPLSEAIAADGAVQEDLARLSGMWLGSRKRAADGAMLLATFDGARQVGPYWSILVTVDGVEPLGVNVISRVEPKIEIGERVLVTGVVFDGDVVWAADCRPLVKKAAAVEDLF